MKKLILLLLAFAPLSVFAQKFGVVNQGDIVQAMPEYTQAQTDLQNESKTFDDELKRMQDELQKKAEAFDKEQATLPDAIKTRRQNELQEMYQKIQQYAQDAQQQMQASEQEKMATISEKLQKAIEEVGANGGFTAIFMEGSMPFISKTLCTDVTAQVKTKLGLK